MSRALGRLNPEKQEGEILVADLSRGLKSVGPGVALDSPGQVL